MNNRGHSLVSGAQFGQAPLPHSDSDDVPNTDEVQLREQHSNFRMGASGRLHHQASRAGGAAAAVLNSSRKGRRRWLQDDDNDTYTDTGDVTDLIPAERLETSGHIVRVRRSEAWGKFLAYEGCCQVCMKEGARGVKEAAYFLSSGCEPLRTGLGISSLLLPQVFASHMAAALGSGNPTLDLGNEIHWDDFEADDKKLSAAAFMNHMSVMKVRMARLELSSSGNVLSRLVCRNADYSRITVHLKMLPMDLTAPVDMPFRLRKDGVVLPGSPCFDLQPKHHQHEVLLEVVQGEEVLARGKVSCKRLWQIGMQHSPAEEEAYDDYDDDAEMCNGATSAPKSICSWLKGPDLQLSKGSIGLWVNVFDSGPTPGKVLLMVQRTQREIPGTEGPREESGSSKGVLKVSSCQAYDYILLAALKAQGCSEKQLEVTGEWAWLLQAFANHYGVRNHYAVMTHLRWVLRPGVASVSQLCFDLLSRQLRGLLEQEAQGALTQHESTMLNRVKKDTEELLKLAFENYYLLSSTARKGIRDGVCSPDPGHSEFPPMALVAGVQLFEAMRDVFHPSDVEWLSGRFRIAAKGRWSRLASLCDDGSQQDMSPPLMSGTAPLMQHIASNGKQGSPAGKTNQLYTRMIRIAAAIQHDLEYDRKLQSVPRLLPSSLNLPGITVSEYCVNYVQQLRSVLTQCPPNQPTEIAIDMLVAVAQLQRYLVENSIAIPQGQPGCIDCLELFAPHVRSWITNSQETLCATCRSLEATTELSTMAATATQEAPPLGSSEEGGVAPICHEMLRHVVNEMHRYERVVSHWPLFGPYLESALCVVLRAIVASVSRQCGMTCVRGGSADTMAKGGSPYKGSQRYSASSRVATPDFRSSRHPGSMAQWTWTQESPRKGLTNHPTPRVLLMVREAVLLNSLKRLMVAVPIYEASINRWSGGHSVPPGPSGDMAPELSGYEDIAPCVGAQFAQVVKELRTEYSSGIASTCQRMSSALSATPATSIVALLSQARVATAQAGNSLTQMQQHAIIESLSSTLFNCLSDMLNNLAAALDSRVFVAATRGLWDFTGRDLLDFVENLQESKDNRGAWRTRQNAQLMLEEVNKFFKSVLVSTMEHVLQERDLTPPLHVDATQKLLAGNTTVLNMNFTPF